MNRRVTIQARTTSQGAAGGVVNTYATEATVWAEKVESRGLEARSSAALREETTAIFRIWYRATLTTLHRIVFQDRSYDILEITEEGLRVTQLIQAKFTEARA